MYAPGASAPQRRYRLIAEIGRGGMAEVYLAVAQGPGGFNKLVVVKKALQDLALRPEILAMFLDEARLAARMNHPNVVQTYEFGEEDGRQFIAMEYLDGQPYSRVLNRLRGRGAGLGQMGLAHHLRILCDTLSGLHHAHELRDFDGSPLHVVHRDVTPQNVFVTYDGSTKVVDFGIAKAQDSSARTVTGEIKGKVTYMSPEQVRGEPLDRRSDLFAVGVMIWEAVAGRRMWRDLPDVTIVHELIHGRVPNIREVVPDVPPDLVRILDRALAIDREGRYPSALAMLRELEEFAVVSRNRVDGPEVGHIVAELFEEERRRVRAVIEAQLGSLRWSGENPAATQLPQIPSAVGSLTGRDWMAQSGAQAAGAAALDFGKGSSPGLPTGSGAALPMPVPLQPGPRRGPILAVAGAILAALITGVVVLAVIRPFQSAPAAASATPGTSSAGLPAAAASVTLKIKVSPPEAKIYLDGVLLGTGAFEGPVARSDAARVLKLEAPGYDTKEERLALTADLMTQLSLDKSAQLTSASATAQPTIGPGIRPPLKPTGRGIDSESPYGAPR